MEVPEDKIKELFKKSLESFIEENKDYIFELFREVILEVIEDKGMLVALNEISKEDQQEVDKDELEAILKGEFINR